MNRPPVLVSSVFAVLAAGCFPDGRSLEPEEHLEADRLELAYEEAFGVEVDARQHECIHSVDIVISTTERDRWCDAYACYWVRAFLPRREGVMFFPNEIVGMSEPSHGQILRHELLHRLLHCVEDDADVDHAHAAWAGAPYVPAPGDSIVATAGSFDPTLERPLGTLGDEVAPELVRLDADVGLAATSDDSSL